MCSHTSSCHVCGVCSLFAPLLLHHEYILRCRSGWQLYRHPETRVPPQLWWLRPPCLLCWSRAPMIHGRAGQSMTTCLSGIAAAKAAALLVHCAYRCDLVTWRPHSRRRDLLPKTPLSLYNKSMCLQASDKLQALRCIHTYCAYSKGYAASNSVLATQ